MIIFKKIFKTCKPFHFHWHYVLISFLIDKSDDIKNSLRILQQIEKYI